MLPELIKRVLETARRNGLEHALLTAPLVVGVSGGPDSLALLHILHTLRGADAPTTLHVAHLDHALRGESGAEDARFVAELADSWGLTSTVSRVDVGQYARERHLSVEEAARHVRYAFLSTLATERNAIVAVAHNADDQAETVLMHLLHGSGLSGLRGMRMLSTVRNAECGVRNEFQSALRTPHSALFRPLLGVWRHEIEEYCAQAGLQPRTDPTNTDLRYTRNRIRHDLLPLLERDYNPAIKERLYTLAELAAGEDDFLDASVEEEAQRLANTEEDGVVAFKPEEIAALPRAMRLRLTRWAIHRAAGTLDGFTHRHIAEAAGILAGDPASPSAADLPHGLVSQRLDGQAIIAKKQVIALPSNEDASQWPLMASGNELPIEPNGEVQLEYGWMLHASVLNANKHNSQPNELTALFDMDALNKLGPLTLRTWRQGDVIQPMGMKGSKRLHDLFIDAKIPKRVRNRIPLVSLSHEGEVLWVPGPGGRRSAHAPITPDTKRVLRLEFINNQTKITK